MKANSGMVALLLLFSCTEGTSDVGDLGSLLPSTDSGSEDLSTVDTTVITGNECIANQGETKRHLFIGGMVYEMTLKNQDPGEILPGVTVDYYDYCDEQFGSVVSGEDGTFSFYIPRGEFGFDGYAEFTKPGYPLFRQFDKPFKGDYIFTAYRLFEGPIFDGPLIMVGQKDNLGFAQGTFYNLMGGLEIPGVKVTASTGDVLYFSDALPVPDADLTETQSRGVFFIANATPGELIIYYTLPDGREGEKKVKVWPVNSYEDKTITQVGVPISPSVEL